MPLPDLQRIPVLGLPLAATDYRGAVQWITAAAIERAGVRAVSAANTHLTTLSRHDPAFASVMARFDINFPDGMPLVWAMNRQLPADRQLGDRVYGPTLMLEVLRATAGNPAIRHFLLGGKDRTLSRLLANFKETIPGLNIAGVYSPPFGPWPEGENEKIAGLIRESTANIIWVGLGCPKQENWIAAHKDQLPAAVYLGIGAAFAFHAGEVSQAPSWMQDRGLEWLYRLATEPRRLFKRYFTYNSLFLWYSLRGNGHPKT